MPLKLFGVVVLSTRITDGDEVLNSVFVLIAGIASTAAVTRGDRNETEMGLWIANGTAELTDSVIAIKGEFLVLSVLRTCPICI
ncbi:hypothetical protein C451_19898 [Halococcus thailandensis JCM 13552]|uniref:Uncharacterized protein n=1 Tax=Halococcus thailandensis JCM 13552 TaxID=1227457 RepID=M0MVK5_9EURY|nr:hypothetical protein C451_19898 [Halococcus thailandensis JCM 13552]